MSRIRLNQEYRNKIANRMRVHLEQEDTQEKKKYDEMKAEQISLNDNAWKIAETIVRRHYTDEDVAKEINADWLIYQKLDDLIESVKEGNPEIEEFETSIFTGEYMTPLVENYLEDLENTRKDELKMQREKSTASD